MYLIWIYFVSKNTILVTKYMKMPDNCIQLLTRMKIAFVDDEDSVLVSYKDFCARYTLENNLPIECRYFSSSLEFIETFKGGYDAIFFDIEMPGINGMEAANIIRAKDENVIIIFVTNMAQYAIDGYKVSALDFILKPFDYSDFSHEIDKIRRNTKSYSKEFVWINKSKPRKVYFAEILYIESVAHDIHVKLFNQSEIVFRGSLSSFEGELGSDSFIRMCKSYIVNADHVKSVIGEELVMDDGSKLYIPSKRKTEFMKALNKAVGIR